MDDAYLPMQKAHEPIENARQPEMHTTKSVNKKTNVTFKEVREVEKSRSNRVYKEILSQPPDNLSHLQKLQWLQKRRSLGLWVQCDSCDRWRYLPDILDSFELPTKWFCSMNPDKTMADCSVPEAPIHLFDEEDLIHSEYSAGSIVLARLAGWPWWPAMVDDCPDAEQFYWLDGFSDIPTHYNVVFFDTEVTRAWVASDKLKPYSQNRKVLKISLKNKAYKKRLELAMAQADDAIKLQLAERLEKYSFINQYKGSINSPINVNEKHAKKYQRHLKRKYNIDLPNDFFDSDDEDKTCNEDLLKANVIIMGSKKKKNDNNENIAADNVLNIDENIKKSSLIVQVGTDKEHNEDGRPSEAENKSELNGTHSTPKLVETIIEESTNYNDSGSPHSNDFDF